MNLARSTMKLSAARYGSSVLQFLSIIYFESAIGLSQLGTFFLFQALLGVLSIPADFGLRGAVEKRISGGTEASKYVSAAALIKVVPIVIIGSGIVILSNELSSYIGIDVTVYLIAGLVIQEGSNLAIAILKGEMRVEETASLEILRKILWILTSIFLVLDGLNVESLIIGHIFALLFVGVIGWTKVSVSMGIPDITHFTSLFSYAKYNFVSSVGGQIYNWTDVLMLGVFLTGAQVAAYEIAWRITSFTIIYSKAISTALFPQISSWHSLGSTGEIEKKLTELLVITPIIVVPAFVGATVFAEEILSILFSEEAAVASLALVVLMIDEITESVQTIVGRALQAVDRPDLAARATVIAVGLNVALNPLLIWNFGITGAALATTVASFVGGVLLHSIYLRRIISLKFPYREWAECCIAALIMGFGLMGVDRIVTVDKIYTLIAVIAFSIVLYFGLLSRSPSIRPAVEKQFQEFRRA